MHEAGIPVEALQLLPGDGATVGAALSSDPRIDGLCFTGSTETARLINRAMARRAPDAPLIAETGGINAMIVDSTALPEQVVRDVIASAFQSAGQRCSALRVLYLQRDVEARFMEMLFGAMDELRVGDPWDLATDIGPVIDAESRDRIEAHLLAHGEQGRLLKRIASPAQGLFVGPAVVRVHSIADVKEEIFGPVLHVATFEADAIDEVVDIINAQGYGLTFGLHTRIDDRVQQVVERIRVGNIYVNRNQIGAIVGSQPFGGEGLSGTGPKAGGPHYVPRFMAANQPCFEPVESPAAGLQALDVALRTVRANWRPSHHSVDDLPGPTGESNRLFAWPRGVVLCAGPGVEAALAQARQALASGCAAVAVAPGIGARGADLADPAAVLVDGVVTPRHLAELSGFDGLCLWTDGDALRDARMALASREGVLIPLISESGQEQRFVIERHLCIDTTAAGGNATLLAASEQAQAS
jgi:RHH-type transcriptional regulator, proline utilization regulon repressor / proline dehydrogenase / delta 1-pyrroline-5-carboxylate dehydrogenase